jgi:6-phosphofructokinase 1
MLAGRSDWHYATFVDGKLGSARLVRISEVYDIENRRPKEQWWMDLLPVMDELARGRLPGATQARSVSG